MKALLFVAALFFSCVSLAQSISGKVVGVSDGDTLTLLTAENSSIKIRLAQIDAPESKQAFGAKSKISLSELAFGKEAEIVIESTDRYGRKVGTVFIDGQDVNLIQVKRGMAWVYIHYAKDQNYFQEERIARTDRVGLWRDESALEPWVWRRNKKMLSTTTK